MERRRPGMHCNHHPTVEILETVDLPLHPWESGREDRFMRLVPGSITGRSFERIPPGAPVNSEARISSVE